MSHIAYVSIPVVLLTAVITMHLIGRRTPQTAEPGRYTSLDGLRGFLALFVFLHHGAYWYGYLRTGTWSGRNVPGLLEQFGPAAVALFFMITALLFTDKILRADDMDWRKLYRSRFLRILPLYYCVFAGVVAIDLACTGPHLRTGAAELFRSLARWVLFVDSPDLNGLRMTSLIVAGVFWSLTYEWFFYFSLPVVSLAVKRRARAGWVAASACVMLLFYAFYWHSKIPWYQLAYFPGGMLAAWAVRSVRLCAFSTSATGTAALLALIVVGAKLGAMPEHLVGVLAITAPFCLIACGCSVGGLLTRPAIRRLGDISYGVYVIHGMVLFVTFRFVIGYEAAARLSAGMHWLIVVAVTPVVVAISWLAHLYIELPAMGKKP